MTEAQLREFWAINYIHATPAEPLNHTLSVHSTRAVVPNAFEFPWSSVGKLYFLAENNKIKTCTASLVENQYEYLLTAAHCVYSTTTGNYATDMMFFYLSFVADDAPPAPDGFPIGNPNYPGIQITNAYISPNWNANRNRAYDYGLVQIDVASIRFWANPTPPTYLLARSLPLGAATLAIGYSGLYAAEYTYSTISDFHPNGNPNIICTVAVLGEGASGGLYLMVGTSSTREESLLES